LVRFQPPITRRLKSLKRTLRLLVQLDQIL
jgi:hypothetical protein